MKQPNFLFSALFFLLLINFNCTAQEMKGEYKTAAGTEYLNFDTAQTITDIIPAARKYKSSDLLRLQLIGNPTHIKVIAYNYFSMVYINDNKNVAWGKYATHEAKIQGGRIITPKTTTYSLLSMPTPPMKQGLSYKPSEYKKDRLKIKEAKDDEAFVIDFFNYSMYLDSNGKLIKEDSLGKYYYNEKGDCVRIATYLNNRQFRYYYQYDNKGNWIKRYLWDSDSGIIQRIDRTITY